MKVVFVGGGNMAGALVGGLIAQGHAAADIRVVDPDAGQRARLAQRFQVAAHADAATALAGAEVVVLAVKPQVMAAVATPLAALVKDCLVVSVAAGIRASDLSRWLGGHRRIVRTMPNMPALIGRGISALAATPDLSAVDRDHAEQILAAVGETLWVEDEAMIDAVTAVSGSGPAYVFYFIEALERAATELGFNSSQARQLALATFRGASELAANSDESAAQLRRRVTSPGGTTAAALAVLGERSAADTLVEAVLAACQRSLELGEQAGGSQPKT
ncbi:MAG: pyrroline-5-carboxylate reductase [Burkholderiaceae bacterium]|nr:pyrroline-5-carboxylate reductase [Burkholderiaceae bacterium]